MGTSHRHTPGVKGEPNWGKSSAAMTSVATAEEKSEQLSNNPPKNVSKHQIEKRQKGYSKSITNGYHRAVRHLVRAVGGRAKASSGSSRAFGHSGVAVAGAFTQAFAEIAQKGLSNWLSDKGFGNIQGKTCSDILNFLREYLSADVVGLDDTAANEALEFILEKLDDRIEDDASNFDDVMKSAMSSTEITEIVDEYMGVYVFSHLSQNFKEKLEQEKGTAIMNSTMEEIKDLIMEDMRRGYKGHNALSIDWTGNEGRDFVKHEFDRIIYILSGNED